MRPSSSATSAVHTMTSLSSAVDGVSDLEVVGQRLAELGDLLLDVGGLDRCVRVVASRTNESSEFVYSGTSSISPFSIARKYTSRDPIASS